MSILRKRGKTKLRFRIMNKRVTNRDFKYLKRLFLRCLSENQDIAERLNENYKFIQVFFFYEATDPNVEIFGGFLSFLFLYMTKTTDQDSGHLISISQS